MRTYLAIFILIMASSLWAQIRPLPPNQNPDIHFPQPIPAPHIVSKNYTDITKRPAEKNSIMHITQIMMQKKPFEFSILPNLSLRSSIEIGLNSGIELNGYLPEFHIPKGFPIGQHRLRWKAISSSYNQCAIIQISPNQFSITTDWRDKSQLVAEYLDCSPIVRDDGTHIETVIDFDHLEKYPPFSYKKIPRVGNFNFLIPEINIPPTGYQHSKFPTWTYYIRVIPVENTRNLKPLALPSPAAILRYNMPPPQPVHLENGMPKLKFLGLELMKPDNFHFYCYMKVTNEDLFFKTLKNGQIINSCDQGNDGFFDSLGDFFTDLWEAVTGFINSISAIYEGIKQGIVNIVLVSINCQTDVCKMVVNTALSSAMTAMGIPPSLPNADALMSMGKDYITEMVASEIGVDPTLIKEGMSQLENLASTTHSSVTAPLGLEMAPEYQYRPTIIKLLIDKNTSFVSKSSTTNLDITNDEGIYRSQTVVIPKNPTSKPGGFVLPIMLQPIEDFRAWLGFHYLAIDRFMQMDFKGYLDNEAASLNEYQRFYQKHLNPQILSFTIRGTNNLTSAPLLKVQCTAPLWICVSKTF